MPDQDGLYIGWHKRAGPGQRWKEVCTAATYAACLKMLLDWVAEHSGSGDSLVREAKKGQP